MFLLSKSLFPPTLLESPKFLLPYQNTFPIAHNVLHITIFFPIAVESEYHRSSSTVPDSRDCRIRWNMFHSSCHRLHRKQAQTRTMACHWGKSRREPRRSDSPHKSISITLKLPQVPHHSRKHTQSQQQSQEEAASSSQRNFPSPFPHLHTH